jgi:hypothetical protein
MLRQRVVNRLGGLSKWNNIGLSYNPPAPDLLLLLLLLPAIIILDDSLLIYIYSRNKNRVAKETLFGWQEVCVCVTVYRTPCRPLMVITRWSFQVAAVFSRYNPKERSGPRLHFYFLFFLLSSTWKLTRRNARASTLIGLSIGQSQIVPTPCIHHNKVISTII